MAGVACMDQLAATGRSLVPTEHRWWIRLGTEHARRDGAAVEAGDPAPGVMYAKHDADPERQVGNRGQIV